MHANNVHGDEPALLELAAELAHVLGALARVEDNDQVGQREGAMKHERVDDYNVLRLVEHAHHRLDKRLGELLRIRGGRHGGEPFADDVTTMRRARDRDEDGARCGVVEASGGR